jgi:hypothetical protein
MVIGAGLVAAFMFLDSGADTGHLVLQPAAAYPAGTLEFVQAHNVYLVKLRDGSFLALSDLDAANRANQARRCRVSPINPVDPVLPGLLEKYAPKFSPAAANGNLIFRETCNGALYDLSGWRLDGAGPPLDRFETGINTEGQVTVELSNRLCAAESGDNYKPCR